MPNNNGLPSFRVLCWTCLFGCLAWMPAGCGGDSHRGAVEGKVAIDDVPIENGAIRFLPTDGNNGPTAGATIKDGRYFIGAEKGPVTGWNLISISGVKKTGKRVTDPLVPGKIVDEVVSVTPKQYNSQSTLKREIKASKNILDFELSSK